MDECQSIRVAIAEANPVLRQQLERLLDRHGFIDTVLATGSGRECVIAAPKLEADMVILGLDLYEMDGLEVIRQLKRSSSPPKCLVVSQYVWLMASCACSVGADYCMAIPFTEGAFLKRVDALTADLAAC